MNLIHYYRQQFIELTAQFEQVWEEDSQYKFGFLWRLQGTTPYKEIFHMTQTGQEPLYLMYAIELPESYKRTNISDVIKSVASDYELSMYVFSSKIMLTSCISIEYLQQTSLGFIHHARAELIDLVFSVIQQVDYEIV
ncbi:hypothetical protein [Paenibacillus qinlingensis]|uniref:Uncharacterized protein n=1 Tax=Paenibacillus qinlingensis TaxID=1837343 RepID=A0ABU1P572_9BACL|nr:hypothetical protein [Paenibacillus qinlingensis]MDR6554904.1 hypothetical protein [Paenibacillus qinlingensis]